MSDGPEASARPGDADAGRRIVRGGASRGLAFGVGNAFAALGAVVLLRYLGVADFGRYGTVIALLAIVQGLSEGGLGVTAMRELALREPAEQRVLLAHVIGARIVLTGLGVFLAVAFAAVAGYGGTLVVGTAVAGAGVLLASVQTAVLLPLAVQLRNGRLAVSEVLRQATVVTVVVVLVVAGAPLSAFFTAQLAAGLILIAAIPFLLDRRELVRPRWDGAELRALARIGLPVALAGALAVLYYRTMVVIVSLLEGERQVGLFVTSARVLELVGGLPLLLSVIAVPLLTVAARDDPARLRSALQQMTEVMAVAGVAAALGLAAGARPLVLLLGGEEYADAVPVLRLQSLALVTVFLGAAWTPTLVGLGRLREVALVSATGLATLVIVGVPATAVFGIKGAAGSVVVADVVLLVGIGAALRAAGPGRELQLGFVPRLLAAMTPPVVAVLVLERAVGGSALFEAAVAVAAVGLFLALALLLRVLPAEFGRALRRVAPG